MRAAFAVVTAVVLGRGARASAQTEQVITTLKKDGKTPVPGVQVLHNPEPASVVLLGLGAGGVTAYRVLRRRARGRA